MLFGDLQLSLFRLEHLLVMLQTNCCGLLWGYLCWQISPYAPTMFSTDSWNMFHHTDVELPGTNNRIESWTCSFQGYLLSSHSSFWKCLRALKNEPSVISGHLGGQVDPPRTAHYIDSLHKEWSFPLRISSVNVTKSAVSCGFGHIYWSNP